MGWLEDLDKLADKSPLKDVPSQEEQTPGAISPVSAMDARASKLRRLQQMQQEQQDRAQVPSITAPVAPQMPEVSPEHAQAGEALGISSDQLAKYDPETRQRILDNAAKMNALKQLGGQRQVAGQDMED